MGTKADSFNNAETKKDSLEPSRGGIPKILRDPIRKRAYYRALKRGEHWALMKQSMNNIMDALNYSFFSDWIKPSPFSKMIGTKELLDSYQAVISYGSAETKKEDT